MTVAMAVITVAMAVITVAVAVEKGRIDFTRKVFCLN